MFTFVKHLPCAELTYYSSVTWTCDYLHCIRTKLSDPSLVKTGKYNEEVCSINSDHVYIIQ